MDEVLKLALQATPAARAPTSPRRRRPPSSLRIVVAHEMRHGTRSVSGVSQEVSVSRVAPCCTDQRLGSSSSSRPTTVFMSTIWRCVDELRTSPSENVARLDLLVRSSAARRAGRSQVGAAVEDHHSRRRSPASGRTRRASRRGLAPGRFPLRTRGARPRAAPSPRSSVPAGSSQIHWPIA